MKMKFNYLLVVAFFFISGLTLAQDKRFVEVTVSDTVTLKFTKLIYEISIGNKSSFMGIEIPMDESGTSTEGLPTTSVSAITMILDKEKFPYTLSTDNNYSLSSAATKSEPKILVAITSEKDLKKLYAMFKSQTGITGKVSDTEYEPVEKYNGQLYKRLYAKAVLEAGHLTSAAGGTTGQLLSVSEKKQSDPYNFMDNYSTMLKGFSSGMFGGTNGESLQKIETITKTFKFELK